MDEIVSYASAGELEKILAIYDQAGQGVYIDNTYRYASLKEVKDTYRANWNVASQDFGDYKTDVYPLAPDLALAVLTANASMVDTEGKSYQEAPAAITIIWIHKEGQWKMHSMHQATESRELMEG